MDENLSPVSAIEDIEAALNEAPICEYPDFTNAVREVLALARQAEALQRENAEKDARIAALEEAITTSFCVVYLDGRNEHGTHVLPVFPTSINEEADDISEQAEAIMAAAEAEGFETEDLVWAEFASVPPQIGDEGRIELAGYWEFRGINAEMSELMNRRARALLGGENAE